MFYGGETILVGRPGFKPGGWRHAPLGGFDSHSPPPSFWGDGVNVRSLEFPDELYYLVEHQVWARLDDKDIACVGITALGIRAAGEIYMCRPKAVGTEVEQHRSIAVVELAKSIVSVKSPVRGRVVQTNHCLSQRPELVHLDPYGEGWLARVALSNWSTDLAALLHGTPVVQAMEHYAWQNRIDAL